MTGSPHTPNDEDLLKRAIAEHGGDLGRALGVPIAKMQNRIADLERRISVLDKRGGRK